MNNQFMSPMSPLTVASAAIALLFSTVANLEPQDGKPQEKQQQQSEIEIINQDGEPLSEKAVRALAEASSIPGVLTTGNGVTIKQEGGKTFFVSPDGTQKEIDTNGAKSVIVNRSVRTVVKDGQEQTESFGKAIIIGPDGQRQEIEIGAPEADGNNGMSILSLPALESVFRADSIANSFYIGVNCDPADETLASQLKFEPNTGLVVKVVTPDSPAANAGLQPHDILLFADDRQLKSTGDLVKIVEQAGENKATFALELVRAGDELTIEVKPAKRPANARPDRVRTFVFGDGGQGFEMKMQQMQPGMIFGGRLDQEFEKTFEQQMQEMRESMKLLQEQMDQLNK